MRVLLTTYAERTHFLMMVPLAWALRTAGHDVRVAVQPKLAGAVTGAAIVVAAVIAAVEIAVATGAAGAITIRPA